ncbi:MAG TPA: hypothetical protein PLH03_02475 [Methylophilaceae bacterium]|nr:hypothetical protein [Methylophilaceae bacterium]
MPALLLLLTLTLPLAALAENPTPSVEDNIRAMDTDRDGMVTVAEVRAYLEARNGKGYKHELLVDMEAKANARSCASPFSQSFY